MNIMKIFNVNDLDVTQFKYSEPKMNAMGGQSIHIAANDEKEKIIIQTPKCNVSKGLNVFTTNQNDKRYSIDLMLHSDTPAMQTFKQFLQKFDDRNCDLAVENSNTWFKKYLDQSVVDEIYRSTMKTHEDGQTMKVKLPVRNDKFIGDIFDQNKQPVSSLSIIQENCTVQAIIECTGMYFIPKEFGITWKVLQLKVTPPSQLERYAFVDENSDEDVEPV